MRLAGGGGGDGCQQNLVQALGHLRVTIGKEWQSRRKASKLKPLPRAYTKVGCHPPTPTTRSLISLNQWPGNGQVRQEEVRGMCRVTMGHLRVTIGNFFLSFTPK